MNNSQLTIIILNWNGWVDTQKCIESIIAKTRRIKYTICVIDNGSKAAEIEIIESYINQSFKYKLLGNKEDFQSNKLSISEPFLMYKSEEKIIFIKNNENLGFAGGNNVGLNILKENHQNNVLLLNNDTELGNDAIAIMHSKIDSLKVGAVIPQIRYHTPNDIIWNCGGSINLFGIRKYYHAFDNISKISNLKTIERVDFGTGCALMFKIDNVGVLSEKYFFGEEDLELSFRLKHKKLDILCMYDAIIYHKVGASRNQISENKVGKMVYHYCQRITNLKDNLSFPLWIVSVALHFLSSLKQLKLAHKLTFTTIFNCWKVILKSTSKDRFTLKDFKTISNQNY